MFMSSLQPRPEKMKCSYCGDRGHTAFLCRNRPKSRLPFRGAVRKKLDKANSDWLLANPPNHQGFWECYICGKWVNIETLNIEHVKSKARNPEERLNQDNLKPACGPCNETKGSKSY